MEGMPLMSVDKGQDDWLQACFVPAEHVLHQPAGDELVVFDTKTDNSFLSFATAS